MAGLTFSGQRAFRAAMGRTFGWAEAALLDELETAFGTEAGRPNAAATALRQAASRELLRGGSVVLARWSDAVLRAAALIEGDAARRRLWHFFATLDVEGGWPRMELGLQCNGVVFPADVIFAGLDLGETCDFNAARFLGRADFSHARFGRGGRFEKATFEAPAAFSHTEWDGSAQFRGATFQAVCAFDHADFRKDAWFRGGAFRSDVSFADASWNGEAGLGAVTYAGFADFRRARFDDNASFDNAVFEGPARFDGARFARNTWFDKVRFEGTTSFDVARFEGRLNFNGVEMSHPRQPVPDMIEALRRGISGGAWPGRASIERPD